MKIATAWTNCEIFYNHFHFSSDAVVTLKCMLKILAGIQLCTPLLELLLFAILKRASSEHKRVQLHRRVRNSHALPRVDRLDVNEFRESFAVFHFIFTQLFSSYTVYFCAAWDPCSSKLNTMFAKEARVSRLFSCTHIARASASTALGE